MGGVIDFVMHNFWFLKSLWVCYMVFWIVHKNDLCIILSCIIAILFIPLWNLNVMYPCFVIGYYYRKIHRMDNIYIILSLSFYLLLLTLRNYIDVLGCYPINNIVKIIMGVSISIFLERMMIKAENRFAFSSFFAKIGRTTLLIYVLQVVLLEHFLANYINLEQYSSFKSNGIILIMSVIIYISICYISHFISSHKLNKILF